MNNTQVSILLLTVLAASVVADPANQNDSWFRDVQDFDNKVYEEVPIFKPKFKSKKQVGLDWTKQRITDSATSQTRHLEWLVGSDSSQESAGEPGFLEELFGSEEKKKDMDPGTEMKDGRRPQYERVNKLIFPLLIAYKLKFFTMVPILIGLLVMLVGTTGLTGFFFALFAAAASIPKKGLHG